MNSRPNVSSVNQITQHTFGCLHAPAWTRIRARPARLAYTRRGACWQKWVQSYVGTQRSNPTRPGRHANQPGAGRGLAMAHCAFVPGSAGHGISRGVLGAAGKSALSSWPGFHWLALRCHRVCGLRLRTEKARLPNSNTWSASCRSAQPHPQIEQLDQLGQVIARSQRSFKELIDSFDDVAFATSLDGKIKTVNRRVTELLGSSLRRGNGSSSRRISGRTETRRRGPGSGPLSRKTPLVGSGSRPAESKRRDRSTSIAHSMQL